MMTTEPFSAPDRCSAAAPHRQGEKYVTPMFQLLLLVKRKLTLKNVRELWNPGISRQWSPEKQDFQNSRDAAIEKTKWILQNHKPKTINKRVMNELKKIIQTAEADLVFAPPSPDGPTVTSSRL